MDERFLEVAEQLEADQRDAAIRRSQEMFDRPRGPEECEECGELMPEVRRNYGFRICVHCAEAEEKSKRLFGK